MLAQEGFWHTDAASGRLFPMSIRGWWASRRQRKREAYAERYGYATPNELEKTKHSTLDTLVTDGMPEGTGISPTGTPMDFTADLKRPRY
jgi:hypothetical protein